MNRDKDLIATTDVHHRPVQVHAQRPGKGLQTKQSESLHAQDSAIQKPDQNRNNMSHTHSLYNHPYALNHIQLVISANYPRLSHTKADQNKNNISHSLYSHPYAQNHIQLVKWTFDNYEVNIFKVLAMIYHQFHVET